MHSVESAGERRWRMMGYFAITSVAIATIGGCMIACLLISVLLSQKPTQYQLMAWSPDERQLAFLANGNQQVFQVFVVNADGSDLRPVTPKYQQTGIVDLFWSADGKSLYYALAPHFYYRVPASG